MSTLSEITYTTRKILKILSFATLLLLGVFILYKIGNIIRMTYFPPPPPPPNEGFGKLPKPDFIVTSEKLNYTLNTKTGFLPDFGTRVEVYKIKKRNPELFSLIIARNNLAKVGFVKNEEKINDILYQWSTQDESVNIKYNILSRNFAIEPVASSGAVQRGWSTDPKDTVFGFLKTIEADLSDIDTEKTRVLYLKTDADTQDFIPARQNDSNFAAVSLFQKQINNLDIVYPYYSESTMRFLVKNGDKPQIVQANFVHQVPDENYHSSYGLISTQEAFENLKNGNAQIFNKGKKTNIEITDIKLSYYLSEKEQDYLLPVFEFLGRDFRAFVVALTPSSFK
jgi:hypothetical protein